MSSIKLKMTFSGLSGNDNNAYHDAKQKIDFVYAFPVYQMKNDDGTKAYYSSDDNQNYSTISEQVENTGLKKYALWRYQNDPKYGFDTTKNNGGAGIYPLLDMVAEPRSFYRREVDPNSQNPYYGEWEPVNVQTSQSYFYDYNVSNGRKYEYVSYPKDPTVSRASYANRENNSASGEITPIETHWEYWSLAELIPASVPIKTPTIKKSYTVNKNNMWIFKYNINMGAQNQNISKAEQQNLGQYSRFSQGLKNNLTSTVECYLGSEITKCSGEYIERMRQLQEAGAVPLSTNEKTKMLIEWRKLMYSKNPKLLRDVKGQKWIVQVYGGSNTVQTNWKNQPDVISFSWAEIESTENITIVGDL